jgi:hypothetical protein
VLRLADEIEDFTAAIHENPLGVFDASDFVLHEARRKQFEMQIHEWKKLGWQTVVFFHNEAERTRFSELRDAEIKRYRDRAWPALSRLHRACGEAGRFDWGRNFWPPSAYASGPGIEAG